MNLHLSISTGFLRRILTFLICLELLFVLIFLLDQWTGTPIWAVHHFFDLDAESNIPAWFSSIQLCMIGILLLFSAGNTLSSDRPSSWFLYVLALGFIFLSADEAAGIHEILSVMLKKREIFPRFAGNHGIWIPLYVTAGVSFLLVTRKQLASLWTKYPRAAAVGTAGMAIFLLGGVGLEILSYEFLRDGSHQVLFNLEVALEEWMEMCGASLILYGVALFESLRQEASGSVACRVAEADLHCRGNEWEDPADRATVNE